MQRVLGVCSAVVSVCGTVVSVCSPAGEARGSRLMTRSCLAQLG